MNLFFGNIKRTIYQVTVNNVNTEVLMMNDELTLHCGLCKLMGNAETCSEWSKKRTLAMCVYDTFIALVYNGDKVSNQYN